MKCSMYELSDYISHANECIKNNDPPDGDINVSLNHPIIVEELNEKNKKTATS